MSNSISSISEIQEEIATILNQNTYFSGHGVEVLVENSKKIEYEIKRAMTSLGIAATVSTPSLTYGGNLGESENASRPFWKLDSFNIVIVESPTMNRGRENYATALDTALQIALTLQEVPSICLNNISQTTQGGLVVVTVNCKTNIVFSLEAD